jgi:hypothetical protein
MTRKDRLRRTVLLCSSFARNLAFYRVGQAGPARKLLSASHPQASFWRQANANFFDMCVLEWCKLLSDRKGEHHWSQVVSNPAAFEPAMLRHVGLDAAAFRAEKEAMRHYRDKFIAHLDDLPVMDIPMLDTAQRSVWFYHGYILAHEVRPGDLVSLPDTANKLILGYEECAAEAVAATAGALAAAP